MSALPVCDVTFGDGDTLSAQLLTPAGDYVALQLVDLYPRLRIQRGMPVTIRSDDGVLHGRVAWVPPLAAYPTLFIAKLDSPSVPDAGTDSLDP